MPFADHTGIIPIVLENLLEIIHTIISSHFAEDHGDISSLRGGSCSHRLFGGPCNPRRLTPGQDTESRGSALWSSTVRFGKNDRLFPEGVDVGSWIITVF